MPANLPTAASPAPPAVEHARVGVDELSLDGTDSMLHKERAPADLPERYARIELANDAALGRSEPEQLARSWKLVLVLAVDDARLSVGEQSLGERAVARAAVAGR